MEKKYVVPAGMQAAVHKVCDEQVISKSVVPFILEAALRWLSDELEGMNKSDPYATFNSAIAEVRRMFLAPEEEIPEEVKGLLYPNAQGIPVLLTDNTVTVRKDVNDRIIEAFRRGQESTQVSNVLFPRAVPRIAPGDDFYTPKAESRPSMAEQVLSLKQSSNIKGAVYNSETQTLTVEFVKGGVYSYAGFDADKAAAFEQADSPGTFLHTQIKGQHFHTKIG